MGRDGISKFIFCKMAEPDLGERERGLINACLIENEIGVGRFVKVFEDTWAFRNGYKFGVSCNSGTSALHLAIKAVEAHNIAIPNFTMSGTAYAALYENRKVTYIPTRADVPLADWEKIDPMQFDTIVMAHIYGRKAYPDGWVGRMKRLNPALIVIDDMAEAHGIQPEGDIACYSFYGNKIMTTGEGGMCLTNNELIADEMRSLANMYFDKERSMIHPKVGHNYRMTNLQAAIGIAQEERLEEFLAKRQLVTKWYNKYLPFDMQLPFRPVVWFYDIKVKNAEKMRKKLKAKGADSRRFFYPMSLQPWGNQMPDPNGLKWYKQGLLLPVHTKMVEGDVKYITDLILDKVPN